METRHLEAFSAVMSSGSITGAARLLARSQPAVTRLIQELEAEIGHPLFQRHGPRVTPTEHGFGLRGDVERALAGLRQVGERARQIASRELPALEVAATSALALGLLPPALAHLEQGLGPSPLQLRTSVPEQVLQAVLGGEVDLGLCSLPLEQRRLITMGIPYRLRHRLEHALGPTQQPALIETNASASALALVQAGLGVAVLEPLTPHGLQSTGVAVRPLDTEVPFFFGVITLPTRPVAPAQQQRTEALVQALLEQARQLPGFQEHPPSAHAHLLDADHGLPARASASIPVSF